MGNRLNLLGIVLCVITLQGCNRLLDPSGSDYQPTRRETLYAEADTAAALAATTLGDGSVAPDVKPGPPKPNPPKPNPPKPKPADPTICPRCEGTGKLFGDGVIRPTCPDCKGSGRIKSNSTGDDPIDNSVNDPADYANNIAKALGPKLDELGDRIVGSIDGNSLKIRSYYSDMEYIDERLVHSAMPEAKPTKAATVKQRDCLTDAETLVVTLIVGLKFDSPEHLAFHTQVLPDLPRSWTVRYMFYAQNKKMANDLIPKHLIKSGLNITTLVGVATAKQLLSVAYPAGPISPRQDPIDEVINPE